MQSNIVKSLKHPDVVEARSRIGQAGRGPAEAYLVDGRRLVEQALEAHARVEHIFFLDPLQEREKHLIELARGRNVPWHVVTRGIFFRLLGLGYETSVRVIAVVGRPDATDPPPTPTETGGLLIGQCIQDPRNVGVLIRTADAWNLAGCLFTDDSADPCCRASVRSTTGSVFRVPVALTDDLADELMRLKAQGIHIVGSSAGARVPCWDVDLTGPRSILLGNESVGLPDAIREFCDDLVAIPMPGGAHSLNVTVAAGILFYERARQMASREVRGE